MNLLEQAYIQLFPESQFPYEASIIYSGKFVGYNANLKLYPRKNILEIAMSKQWQEIDIEITLGLIQVLLVKLFKKKRTTINMELYHLFMKHAHLAAPRIDAPPELVASFHRVNDKYFSGMMDQPNLIWGKESSRKLGSYDYGRDTITMSSLLQNVRQEVLDYIMYHELLHKKHKFAVKNGRSYHHTRIFKTDEQRFENAQAIEKELERFSFARC
ncbi:SprT-like domain-containing protein [Candidatus Woesearchaeota archaeon]|nr:SprT-like domain-containing protein [Candidatus Woesearchaeota archaeon]